MMNKNVLFIPIKWATVNPAIFHGGWRRGGEINGTCNIRVWNLFSQSGIPEPSVSLGGM
jgi:hypothetical protein